MAINGGFIQADIEEWFCDELQKQQQIVGIAL